MTATSWCTPTRRTRAVEAHRFSFRDAMIRSIARENGVGEIQTEDLQDGRVVEGVRFRNPLK